MAKVNNTKPKLLLHQPDVLIWLVLSLKILVLLNWTQCFFFLYLWQVRSSLHNQCSFSPHLLYLLWDPLEDLFGKNRTVFSNMKLNIIFHTKLKAHCISFLTTCRVPISLRDKASSKLFHLFIDCHLKLYCYCSLRCSFGKSVWIHYIF